MDSHPQEPLKYIESTLCSILEEILLRPLGQPKITLKRIARDPSFGSTGRIKEREITYCWPGKNREEAWRFACVGKILAEIHDAIQRGIMITKRDIYYRDPELYGKQALVDRYVDDIAYTCNVTRRELNVTASAKGLYAGLRMRGSGDEGSDQCFETVPDSISELQEHRLDHLNWVLVIEKEATFRSLVEKSFYSHNTNGLGLLAKGYPDLSTRRFLRSICDHSAWHSRPRSPIFGLFDADPDGINIMQVYRQGSHSLPHERAFNVPEMQWLGVRAQDVLANVGDDETVLRLTARDKRKAIGMLERLQEKREDAVNEQCRVELQRMLLLNVKAEIQILEDRPGGLEEWLSSKIRSQRC